MSAQSVLAKIYLKKKILTHQVPYCSPLRAQVTAHNENENLAAQSHDD